MQEAAEHAKNSEQDKQKQFAELYEDHEALRKKSMMQLQEKVCSGKQSSDIVKSV